MMKTLKQSINSLIFNARIERLEKEISELKTTSEETNKKLDELIKSSHKTRPAIGTGYLPPVH